MKEEFVPIEKGKVKIYACGPTVYNYIHIGNARPLCVCDVLRRYLGYIGYDVLYVQNFTDIDDKIIKKAKEEKTDYLAVSEKYINEYYKDSKGLNIKNATIHPRATENIDEIIHMIQALEEKAYAYKGENGDVYFRTEKFKNYGKLSKQPLDALEAGARIEVEEIKENPMDFVLWKAAKEGEPYWASPWGNGRPGWHIECSAMVRRYLGETIDIHYGGQDLIFPHHENEIAQSEALSGKTFANYWMHNGYINIDNKKMSKSLNNFFTVREVADIYGYEPIRLLMIASHYRNPINYSDEVMNQCVASLERLYSCRDNLEFALEHCSNDNGENNEELMNSFLKHKENFMDAMDDDLNTAAALASLFDLTKDINTAMANKKNKNLKLIRFARGIFDELCEILGLLYNRRDVTLEREVENLIKQREKARKEKNWALADQIRDELKSRNVILEDTKSGVKWSILK